MKKINIVISLGLLFSQLFFPITSLATELDNVHTDLKQDNTSSSNLATEDTAMQHNTEGKNQDNTSAESLITKDSSQENFSSTEPFVLADNSMDSWMPDKNLQEIVSEILGKDIFTQEDMLNITSASIDNKIISNAQGLSYAKNLSYLSVTNTDLSKTSNLSEVGTLQNLTTLIATEDNLSDISFIKSNNLNLLKYVDISQNALTNLNSISHITLPTIEYLDVSYNAINDISILKNAHVPKLDTLIATNNQILDISPIVNSTITSLKSLDVSHNFIADIDSFANSTFLNLEELIISDNQLSDISIMKNLKDRYPNLHVYNVNNNNISNIDFMEGYNLDSATSALNQTFENTISLIKPLDTSKTQIEIPVPITSLDYQYDSSSGYYLGVPDPSAQNLNLSNIKGISNVKLTDGTLTSVDNNSNTNGVQSFIIDGSLANLPSQINFNWSGAQGQFTGNATININWLNAQVPVIEVENKTLYVGDTFDALNSVKAYDKQLDNSLQTDLTDKVKVLENNVNTGTAGLYSVKYSVTNSYGLTTEKMITVQVKENEQSINGSDYSMYVGDKNATLADFNPSATDKDGNAIDVTTDLSKIDFSKAGTYEVILTATDGQTKKVNLTIKSKKVVTPSQTPFDPSTVKSNGVASIPNKSFTNAKDVTSKPSKSSLPSTGERFSITLYVAGITLSAVASTLYLFIRKIKRY